MAEIVEPKTRNTCRLARGRPGFSAELAAPYFPAMNFWNLGFPRSGSKLGSIFSQPGDT